MKLSYIFIFLRQISYVDSPVVVLPRVLAGDVSGPGDVSGDVRTFLWLLFWSGAALLLGRSGKAGKLLCLGAIQKETIQKCLQLDEYFHS